MRGAILIIFLVVAQLCLIDAFTAQNFKEGRRTHGHGWPRPHEGEGHEDGHHEEQHPGHEGGGGGRWTREHKMQFRRDFTTFRLESGLDKQIYTILSDKGIKVNAEYDNCGNTTQVLRVAAKIGSRIVVIDENGTLDINGDRISGNEFTMEFQGGEIRKFRWGAVLVKFGPYRLFVKPKGSRHGPSCHERSEHRHYDHDRFERHHDWTGRHTDWAGRHHDWAGAQKDWIHVKEMAKDWIEREVLQVNKQEGEDLHSKKEGYPVPDMAGKDDNHNSEKESMKKEEPSCAFLRTSISVLKTAKVTPGGFLGKRISVSPKEDIIADILA